MRSVSLWNVRSFHVANVTADTLKEPNLLKHVSPDAIVYSDSAGQYRKAKLGREFATHETVNHMMGGYARGRVHTNTVEGFFAMLKRGITGTFHHVSEQHVQRHVSEFDFRASNRTVTDTVRADNALKSISGKRLNLSTDYSEH